MKAMNANKTDRPSVMRMQWLMVLGLLLSVTAPAQQKIRKTVFIVADGIPAGLIEKREVPNLRSIARTGGYTRSYVGGIKGTYSETPTISAVGYNTILTGTWVNKHNVLDNDIAAPNYHYYSIFRFFKEQYPRLTTAIFSSWEDNRTKLAGDRLPATGNLAINYAYDGLEKDTLHFPHDKNGYYISVIDEAVAKRAAFTIQTVAPDLSWVYLEYPDEMGHRHGDSPEFYKAIEMADTRIGYIWKAVQYRQQHFNEDWLIIVTTDHGRDSITGKGHGGQSERERASWIFTNAKSLNPQFQAPRASAADIMPTIARFMRVKIPADNNFEIDGTPFTGPLSFITPVFACAGNELQIQWKMVTGAGPVKVWLATTNQFKTGGKDVYTLLGTVPLAAQKARFDLSGRPSSFYKIVLEATDNIANYWIQKK